VIKSDGYGHGIVEVARAFADAGARQFAVFRLEEALTLRRAGITQDLWIMMGLLPEEAEEANDAGFRIACPDHATARMLSQIAPARKRHFDIHVKVDTGMGRLGILPETVADVVRELTALPGLRLRGIFSHLANADSPEHPVTRQQLDCFRTLLPVLPATCSEITSAPRGRSSTATCRNCPTSAQASVFTARRIPGSAAGPAASAVPAQPHHLPQEPPGWRECLLQLHLHSQAPLAGRRPARGLCRRLPA
jgi:alanine racemase